MNVKSFAEALLGTLTDTGLFEQVSFCPIQSVTIRACEARVQKVFLSPGLYA